LENLLCEETDGDVVQQLDEINQDDGPVVAKDLLEEESRDITEECRCCEGIYKVNEVLMRERCGVSGVACERVSLEEGVMEEVVFFSDNEGDSDDVSGGALDVSRSKDSDFRNVSPARVVGGSELAEEDDGDCVGESDITFDPGADPTWTAETSVDGHIGLDDGNETALAVGDAYGEELACNMEQEQASICGLSGGSFVVESVDPPWASNVGEMASAKQQVLVYDEAKHTKATKGLASGVEKGSLGGVSALGQLGFVEEEAVSPHSFGKLNSGTHHVFDPGEEACVIAMNSTGLESSSIGAECWPRRSEECCREQQLGTVTLRDGSRLQNGRRCADTVKPVLRLRGGGSVPRKQGCRKSGGGRRIKPPAKRRRLAEAGTTTHEVRAEGLTGTGTSGQVVKDGRWLDRRILLAGEAQPTRGRELELNSLLCRLNVMAGWVSLSETVTFDEHI